MTFTSTDSAARDAAFWKASTLAREFVTSLRRWAISLQKDTL
jgi:hypothetical protein